MKKGKALAILSSLSGEEFNSFKKFLISPFFNRAKDMVKLFNVIQKYYPEFNDPALTPELVYRKLYPSKKYNEATVRNLFSDLGGLAEKYLAYLGYENSFNYKHNILVQLNDRWLDKLFIKNYKKYKEIDEDGDNEFYMRKLNTFLLENELNEYSIRRNDEKSSKAILNSSLDMLVNLTLCILLSPLPFKHKGLSRKFLEVTDLDELVRFINLKDDQHWEIEFLYLLIKSKKADPMLFYRHIESARKLFYKNEINLGKNERYNYYISLVNAVSLREKVDYNLVFQLRKEAHDKGLTSIAFTGKYKFREFIIILNAALQAGETAWAKNFLKDNIDMALDTEKDMIYNFCNAHIAFFESRFDAALEYLSRMKNEDLSIIPVSRCIKLMSYYELDYVEEAFLTIESFRQFLRRRFKQSPKKQTYLNFLKFYSLILKKKSGEKIDAESLKKDIESCDRLIYGKWLLEKTAGVNK